ncbi:MAG: multiheme c-type cytochrome [Gammaproteobacteria bacterium]|nr:multiheme c-type cytochrome [Gammaproteobacteria bacterium]
MTVNHSHSRQFLFICLIIPLWSSFVANSFAEKVTLDPSNWGLKEGEACISCHKKASAGLTHAWKNSAHGEAGVNCLDCHLAEQDDNDAIEHEGSIIATIVSPKDCGRCHTKEYQETEASVHSKAIAVIKDHLPGQSDDPSGKEMQSAGCASCHGSVVEVRGDGTLSPETWPNTGIGRVNPDGSRGSCSACHTRHSFSKAQARDPSACTWCHTGPDSPDDKVYWSSKHGAMFNANRDKMNLSSDTWVLGKDYSAAPTCVTCHMGASPGIKPSHDVGMRNAWGLNGPVSEKQHLVIFEDNDRRNLPASQTAPRRGTEISKVTGEMGKVKAVATPKRRRQIMSKVCLECHNKNFVNDFMKQFDNLVELYNEKYGKPAQAIMQTLYAEDLLTPAPFDEPLESIYWRLWHDEATKARHGAAMMSPNLTWWEGMHRVAHNFYNEFLPAVRKVAGEDRANSLIDEHVGSLEHHKWLKDASITNPILGYGIGRTSHD